MKTIAGLIIVAAGLLVSVSSAPQPAVPSASQAVSNAKPIETPQRESVKNGVVFYGACCFPTETEIVAMDLSEVVKRHPKEKKFRAGWDYAAGGGSGYGHVVYDRTAQTVRFFSHNASEGFGEGEYYALFSKVTDELIHRLAEDVKNREKQDGKVSTEALYFDHLRSFGCPWRKMTRESSGIL